MRILVLWLVEGECARLVQQPTGKPVVLINFSIIGIYAFCRRGGREGNQVMELGSYSCFFYERKDGHIIIL